jgi:branched-chain amino acid transport system substrate-binding protein
MCMNCALASLRFGRSNAQAATTPDDIASGPPLTRRSFGAGVLAAGLTIGNRTLAADSITVKIGTFGPFTGPAAGLGLQAKKGIEFAVQQFNAAGGLNGKRVELISYDDRANRAEAVSVVRKLIENDGVQAIVDGSLSLTSIAAAPVVNDAKIPMVAAYANAVGIVKGEDHVFRWASVADVQGWVVGHHAMKERKLQTFAILMQDEEYGRGIINGAERAIEELHGRVAYKKAFAPAEREFRAIMTEIKALGVDSVIMSGFSPSLTSAARTGYELEVFPKAQFYIGCSATEIDWYNGIGSYGQGTIAALEFLAPTDHPFTMQFVADYLKATGEKVVSHQAGLSYDATRLVFDAMKRGGTSAKGIWQALGETKSFMNLSGVDVKYTELREPMLPIALSAWDSPSQQYKLVKVEHDPALIDPRPWYKYYR